MSILRAFLKRRWPSWSLPAFFIVMTILITIMNDVLGDEEAFLVFCLLFFLTMAVVLTRWFFLQIKSILRLKKEKTQAELMHLKSQVNPHFFFNTLNNLYGLVRQDSAKAQQLILKLSDMMRYSIYEGQNDFVSLEEEIIYLENYIELHRMRYHKKINVQFDQRVEDPSIKISPLLFIILLENAFKHGVENLRKDAFVAIKLKATKKTIDFEIENNFDTEEERSKPGIGLKNLRRRLELLYHNKHKLTTSRRDAIYQAQLKLQL